VIKGKNMSEDLDVIIFGASGDLAGKKIFPAFFSLFCRGLLPENIRFSGYARTAMTDEEFRSKIERNLTCRYTPESSCGEYIKDFLNRCYYYHGEYSSEDQYRGIIKTESKGSDRLFYLAVPPVLFEEISETLRRSGLVYSASDSNWSRIIIEKPFGYDRASSDLLNNTLSKCFSEDQIYRIDHYLGKEVVQNILVFRFANIIFQPVWSSEYIEKIEINWSEKQGVTGRTGYFDNYGIIRDVIQNHLLQVLALITMEPPDNLDPDEIRDKKVALLKNITPPSLKDIVIGQYDSVMINGKKMPAYREEAGVKKNTKTPTYAFIKFIIKGPRWNNIPVEVSAGKALNSHKAEIIITFKKSCGNIFCVTGNCPPANKLVMRIQPNEGIHFIIATKVPGRKLDIQPKELDLSYTKAFTDNILPGAYENLLLDAIKGDRTLFIRNDELQELWNILTPVLKEIDDLQLEPVLYPYGSEGPSVKSMKKEINCNEKYNSF
jgi:glucose-6-phosphate 1-dehydrogenase